MTIIETLTLASEHTGQNGMRYFLQSSNSKGSSTSYGNNQSAGHYIKSGDAKIYYEIYGEGKPIFIFHGGGVGSP